MEIHGKKSATVARSSNGKPTADQQTMVGFEDEAMTIIERLTGRKKQLDVISIVGMAGLGKTTLARKIYSDPLIAYHFYICGWIHVSQVYQKKDLLLGLLGSIAKYKDEIHQMIDEGEQAEGQLGGELYRRLVGKRYLIVIDDIWDLESWIFLKKCFPKENNRSRILITTQLANVALQVKRDSKPHMLRFLTPKESWDLFDAFLGEACPLELVEIGKVIAARCRGLPLAVVVVAGILAKKNMTQNTWGQVAKRVSSNLARDIPYFMGILEMSYRHLPTHLQPCFVYFGEFPVGHEFSVWRLLSLWIAEGFIQQSEVQSLEHVAEDYLKDLVERSLVIPTKRGYEGRIKACRVHDMIHDLCKRIASERKFHDRVHQRASEHSSGSLPYNYPHFYSDEPNSLLNMSGKSPSVASLYSSPFESNASRMLNKSFVRSLWALDMSNITVKKFPYEVVQLSHFRYLALKVYSVSKLPRSMSNLQNLETLIVHRMRAGQVTLPNTFCNMSMLRHLCIVPQMNIELLNCTGHNSQWNNLLNISTLRLSAFSEDVLAKAPNLRKLALLIPAQWTGFEEFTFPNLASLLHLETLKLVDERIKPLQTSFPTLSKLPTNLKKLTLLGGHMDWGQANLLGMLLNLEVLKLKRNCFKGMFWEINDGGFYKLKFLKLEDMDLEQWNASIDHFPCLQKVVFSRCIHLKEIPSCLGDIPTIQTLEVYWSSASVADSVEKIKKEQEDKGNDGLNIFVYPQTNPSITPRKDSKRRWTLW